MGASKIIHTYPYLARPPMPHLHPYFDDTKCENLEFDLEARN